MTFFDTADIYGDGRSETIIGSYLADNLDVLVAEEAIARYGERVETADEALTAIARPGVASA